MGEWLPAFKAYDVRGVVPEELNPEIAYRIGRAYADETGAKTVCVGHDIRLSGPEISEALAKGLKEAGVDVVDLGMVGTEMVYFATAYYGYDGGVMITASHNPPQYNGMKMVREGSRPISGDSGLKNIERRTYEGKWERSGSGTLGSKDAYPDFVGHLAKFDADGAIGPLRVLASAGNGAAGVAMRAMAPTTNMDVVEMMFEPDGSFPNGVPNPILPESRRPVEEEMAKGGYDFGVAWDGDYDRCFFFDERGNFIEGYYIVGLLAQAMLHDNPGATVIYDPRLTWNTLDIVKAAGGRAVMCKSGHAFIKEAMRAENAVYGGEMSAHHYFREHWYCDSGLIPLILVARLVCKTGRNLGDLVGAMVAAYPCSGEINSQVADVRAVLAKVEASYRGKVEKVDGLSVEFDNWRFNLRGSNTEPVIRLNVESRGDIGLMQEKTDELLALVRS
ncbi:MAG: phosphomannomutase CpsG [Fimbriimonadaceae bacterium]|nr:phosphomannomutase CpsG [Fimbriimonadaceae bacterium]QYK56310.1 MAG: phosphomannomutase CpsG [Fimbriimonadaceae bacterium]